MKLLLRLAVSCFAGAVLVLAACDRPGGPAAVRGYVILRDGDSGDVRGSVVELRRTNDITDPPAYRVTVDSGNRFHRASFAIGDVEPDSYFVLTWQDLDGDETISDGDLVGEYAGAYRRDEFGTRIRVSAGDTADAGSLELGRLVQLTVDVSAARLDSGRALQVSYRFNHDVTLELVTVAFPAGNTLPDPDAVGERLADSTYAGTIWRLGDPFMPGGWHGLVFYGRVNGVSFVRGATVFVRQP